MKHSGCNQNVILARKLLNATVSLQVIIYSFTSKYGSNPSRFSSFNNVSVSTQQVISFSDSLHWHSLQPPRHKVRQASDVETKLVPWPCWKTLWVYELVFSPCRHNEKAHNCGESFPATPVASSLSKSCQKVELMLLKPGPYGNWAMAHLRDH